MPEGLETSRSSRAERSTHSLGFAANRKEARNSPRPADQVRRMGSPRLKCLGEVYACSRIAASAAQGFGSNVRLIAPAASIFVGNVGEDAPFAVNESDVDAV